MTQYLAAALSLVGLWGIKDRRPAGPLCALAGSVVWVMYGLLTAQWGLAVTECAFVLSYLAIIREWSK